MARPFCYSGAAAGPMLANNFRFHLHTRRRRERMAPFVDGPIREVTGAAKLLQIAGRQKSEPE